MPTNASTSTTDLTTDLTTTTSSSYNVGYGEFVGILEKLKVKRICNAREKDCKKGRLEKKGNNGRRVRA